MTFYVKESGKQSIWNAGDDIPMPPVEKAKLQEIEVKHRSHSRAPESTRKAHAYTCELKSMLPLSLLVRRRGPVTIHRPDANVSPSHFILEIGGQDA